MSIFEDKKHNNGKYIGQVPVISCPEDPLKRTQTGNNDEVGYPYPHGTRSVPNAGSHGTGEEK